MSTSDRAFANASKRNLSHRHHLKQRARLHQTRRLLLEGLEARHLLAATLYVDNPGDFVVTNDVAPPGLSAGDTVTWNPGAGSQHGGAVAGLTFGTNAFSTIQSADQILVLEGGEIVERGTHEELLAAGGRYKQLYDKQYKLERNRFINPGEDFTPEPQPLASVGSAPPLRPL